MRISEAHGDIVNENVEDKYNIQLLGSSDKNKYEALVDSQEKLFLTEWHPEYSPMFQINRAKIHIKFFKKEELTDENVKKYIEEAEVDD